MNEKLIIKEIKENKNEYIQFFRDLVKLNSYNPPGNEKIIALKMQEYLKKENIDCDVFSFGNNRANLLAYLNNTSPWGMTNYTSKQPKNEIPWVEKLNHLSWKEIQQLIKQQTGIWPKSKQQMRSILEKYNG